jgi:hypothetical protein
VNSTILTVLSLALSASVAAGATYHVSPDGDDTAAGTADQPWATPHHAVEQARAGDRILLHDGLYPLNQPLVITQQGEPDAWIELAAAPGATPVLDASGYKPRNRGESGNSGAITLRGAAYVRLVGLTVRNSHMAGIAMHGPSHHVDIQDCTVDRTFAPGIGVWKGCSMIRIVGNEITAATIPEMALRPEWVGREPPHEALSVMGADGFEVAWNHVHHCGKEGIDIKEVARHGIVHHNYVHHVPRQALYADAWFGLLEDVEFVSNVAHDSVWGLALSVEGRDSEMRNVRVHHNVLYNNSGSGIYFGTWGTDGPRRDIVIAHNTLWRNGLDPRHYAGSVGSIDVRGKDVRDTLIINNLCAGGGAFEIATFMPTHARPRGLEELNIQIVGNLIETFRTQTHAPEQWGQPFPVRGDATVLGDPRLADPAAGDFGLRSDSPAIDAGQPTELSLEEDGSRPDIGALPRGVSKLPPPPPTTLEGFPAYRPTRTAAFPAMIRP